MSITDEQIAKIEDYCAGKYAEGFAMAHNLALVDILALITRLREAERDAARLDKLDSLCEAYGFEGIHEGNRWMIDGPYRDIRAAIDGMQGEKP